MDAFWRCRVSHVMKTVVLIIVTLEATSKRPDSCEVFTESQRVKSGSDVMVYFKAPPDSSCRTLPQFNLNRVYWTLNKQKIDKRFYNVNDTFASVSIKTFSSKGTIECCIDGIVLGGSIISAYSLSRPQNLSCVIQMDSLNWFKTVCKWKHKWSGDTHYTVYLQQKGKKTLSCKSTRTFCTFSDEAGPCVHRGMNVTVIAVNADGECSSEEVIYDELWSIVQLKAPQNVQVQPQQDCFKVTWETNDSFSKDCELRSIEMTSDMKTVVSSLRNISENIFEMVGVMPCSNYSISVRCALSLKGEVPLWSSWSKAVTVLSHLNVTGIHFHIWRTVMSNENFRRTVLLIWEGIPPVCNAFDEYHLFYQKRTANSVLGPNITVGHFSPFLNHTFITIGQEAHRIFIAAYSNNVNLRYVYIDIPSTAEDSLDSKSLPGLHYIPLKENQARVSWDSLSRPVDGYLIVWNSTQENHRWQLIEDTDFVLMGEPFKLYTISVTPVYSEGSGSQNSLHLYVLEGNPAAVSDVQVNWFNDREAEIQWRPVSPTQCCALVINYTLFYKTHSGVELDVTVDKDLHKTILQQLQPSTKYSVHVVSNSAASSSTSADITFSTKSYGEDILIILIACCVGIILLPVIIMSGLIFWKKSVHRLFPNPHYSSLVVWSTQKCKKIHSWTQFQPHEKSEKILPCTLDSEDTVVVSTDVTNEGLLRPWTEDLSHLSMCADSISSVETKSTTLTNSDDELPATKREKPIQPESKSNIPPAHLNQPLTPYRSQSTLTGKAVYHGIKPSLSERPEALFKLKFHSITYPVTTYVTVDMYEQSRSQSK